MKKRIILILMVFCSVLTFYAFRHSHKSEKSVIFNDNEIISQAGDSFSYVSRAGHMDQHKMEAEFKGFSGSDTIWIMDFTQQAEVEFRYSSAVSKGRLKGVVITPQKDVNQVFEHDTEGIHSLIGTEGRYRFKLVGDDANGKIEIEIKADENVTIFLSK